MPQPDLNRLKSILLTSGIQKSQPALHQVIWSLIDFVQANFNSTDTNVGTPGSGSGGAINQSILTVNNDQSTLPNSRQLAAGSGVSLMNNGKQLLISSAMPIPRDGVDGMDGMPGSPGLPGPPGIMGPPGIDGESFVEYAVPMAATTVITGAP